MTQTKLVTLYLDNTSFKTSGLLGSYAQFHGQVEEHLENYFRDGWSVSSIAGMGGNSEGITCRGWFAVVLQK